jgi:FixJ family two-component response regulator
MRGRELGDRLKGLRADLRILYVSGYTDTAIVHHGVLDPGTHFLHKPFTPEQLAMKVREVLHGQTVPEHQ